MESSNKTEYINTEEERKLWGQRVRSVYTYTKKRFDKEAKNYIRMFRNEFSGLLPERLLSSDSLDVNVIYPVIKAFIPSLYFQDPKVFVKAEQEKIIRPVITVQQDEKGQEVEIPQIDSQTGEPMVETYDAVKSALKFQSALNQNIRTAKLKRQVKRTIQDALLTFYGAIKLGWGNDQGVATMGEGAPPSISESVDDDKAYGIRLKPWDVVVELPGFYNPGWIAVRYTVTPEQLKNDLRLQNTEEIEGKSSVSQEDKERYWKDLDVSNLKLTEYFELYIKPCAKYPAGKYYIFTDEVKEKFLYESDWPFKSKEFPIKILYFDDDPEDGLPIPGVRYIASHQKAKLNIRNAEYEYVQRSIPIMGINTSGVKNPETVRKQITSNTIPRVVDTNQNPNKVLGGAAFPTLGIDFRKLESNIDGDVSRMMGLAGPISPTQDVLATQVKVADKGEQVRQNEKSDIINDYMSSIVEFWAALYQEFASLENYSTVDGEKFPVHWTRHEINGKFRFQVKPFSMSYEDPVIRRRQWVDLLNLLASPALQMALQKQGASVDFLKIINRVLESYDERDVESFVISDMALPENQAAMAVQETQEALMGNGQLIAVKPTDNDKLHIIIHSALGGDSMHEHILQHNQQMLMKAGITSGPGGGNKENPNGVVGNATSQEQLRQPLEPNVINANTASEREAYKPTDTR